MKSRHVLVLLLAVMALYGLCAGYFGVRGMEPPKAVEFALSIAFVVLTYIWYHQDAAERDFHRTMPLGAAIILVSLVSVPYYLLRSRAKGQRGKALLRLLGFCLALLGVPMVMVFVVALLAGQQA